MKELKIALAQENFIVGALEHNKSKILGTYKRCVKEKADLVVFSELCVTGYPPEDLVLRSHFLSQTATRLNEIVETTKGKPTAIIIGAPHQDNGKVYNAAFLIEDGKIHSTCYKHDLPNYGVFDEKRVFSPGPLPEPIEWRGVKIGLMICEDMWNPGLSESLRGSELLISINGSPFELGKHAKRLERASLQSRALQLPLIYVNQFGGQDDLVFDGDSFVITRTQEMIVRLSRSQAETVYTYWQRQLDFWQCEPGQMKIYPTEEEVIYLAMCTGLRDYVEKNNFPGVILGLSGGIDSALTAAVAVDALGRERVTGVMMPSRFTSEASLVDAEKTARMLGLKYMNISIEKPFEAYEETLAPVFAGKEADITEENLQSRIRGMLLMAMSNKFGDLVLSTSNKSEVATGYGTLYGDMCGGYSVLKDVYKTRIFALCRWRNEHVPENGKGPGGIVIPERVITKAPTAELRKDQKDEDSLPPYETLDLILYRLIEQELPVEALINEGFERKIVEKVIRLLYKSEFKRRQSPLGVKISVKPFSRDRRYPITSGYKG